MARRAPTRRWKQWSEVEARAALGKWKESSARIGVCAEPGLLGQTPVLLAVAPGSADELVFVLVVAPTRRDREARIELEQAGVVLRVREGLEVEHLARIVVALSRRAAAC